jgi:hypothetical protein
MQAFIDIKYCIFTAGVRSLREVDIKNIEVDPCNDAKGIIIDPKLNYENHSLIFTILISFVRKRIFLEK